MCIKIRLSYLSKYYLSLKMAPIEGAETYS
jgi:hypothetical protein